MDELLKSLTKLGDFFASKGVDILEAIAIFLAFIVLVRIITKIINKALYRTRITPIMISFVISIITFIGYLIGLIIALKHLNVNTTSFIAIASAVSLAISLALKDLVANLASGFIILMTKPFTQGDYIQLNSLEGYVKSISMYHTKVVTYGNRVISIPNGQLTTNAVINYTERTNIRVSFSLPIASNQSIDKITSILKDSIKDIKYIHKSPAPSFVCSGLADNGLLYDVKVWVDTAKYWDGYYDVFKATITALQNEGIYIQPKGIRFIDIPPRAISEKLGGNN